MAFSNLEMLLEAMVVDDSTVDDGNLSYDQFVGTLAKDMGSPQQDLIHMAVGISGEAGELLDAIKKYWAYNKPLDRANVVEELGDLEFYMQGMRLLLGIDRQEVLAANYQKLKVRYSAGYSDQAAQERADKVEQVELQVIDMSPEGLRARLSEVKLPEATLDMGVSEDQPTETGKENDNANRSNDSTEQPG